MTAIYMAEHRRAAVEKLNSIHGSPNAALVYAILDLAESVRYAAELGQPTPIVLPTMPEPITHIDPLPGSNGDRRPHSRACGLFCRGHGRDCSSDCPTCHGSADESAWRPA